MYRIYLWTGILSEFIHLVWIGWPLSRCMCSAYDRLFRIISTKVKLFKIYAYISTSNFV